MDGPRGQKQQAAAQIVRLACLSIAACGVLATFACATSADEPDQHAAGPTLEILALSRGRGVPEATGKALQAIAAAADSATESGLVISVARQTIGLEGETRLCIVFRNQSALMSMIEEIRKLAAGADLLQIKEENNKCAGKQGA